MSTLVLQSSLSPTSFAYLRTPKEVSKTVGTVSTVRRRSLLTVLGSMMLTIISVDWQGTMCFDSYIAAFVKLGTAMQKYTLERTCATPSARSSCSCGVVSKAGSKYSNSVPLHTTLTVAMFLHSNHVYGVQADRPVFWEQSSIFVLFLQYLSTRRFVGVWYFSRRHTNWREVSWYHLLWFSQYAEGILVDDIGFK